MGWELTAFTVPFALVSAALVALSIAISRAARRETDTGACLVVALIVGTALWVSLYTLQVSQTAVTVSVFIAKLELAALTVLPPVWLAYVLWYTGRERWLTTGVFGPLFGVGLLLVLAIATNEAHLLFWESVRLEASAVNTVAVAHGPLFIVHVAYLYATLAAATGLLAGTMLGTRGVLRAQSASLLAFSLAPAVAGVADAAGYAVVPGLNLAVLATVVTALAGAVSLFRFRWLELQPVTRDHVLSAMADPTIVVDDDGNVIDHNPRAAAIFTGAREGDFVGRRVDEIAPALGELLSTRPASGNTETTLATTEGRKRFEVTMTHTEQSGVAAGDCAILLLHDVTERVAAKSTLADGRVTMKRLVGVARDLSEATEPTTVRERTVRAARHLVDADHARLFDDEDRTSLASTAETNAFADALSATIAERVAEAGQSHVVDDLTIRGTTVDAGGPNPPEGPDSPESPGSAASPEPDASPDVTDAPGGSTLSDGSGEPNVDTPETNGGHSPTSRVSADAGGAATSDATASPDGRRSGATTPGSTPPGSTPPGTTPPGMSPPGATRSGTTPTDSTPPGVAPSGPTPSVTTSSGTTPSDGAGPADPADLTGPTDPILEETFGSLVSVPVDGVGVLQAFSRDVDAFDETDVETLRLLSAHVASASEQVDTEADLRDERDRLDEFASVVSHDLRNPLSVATGFLDLAREDPDDEHFDRAEGALDRMDNLLDDLLQLARHGNTIGERERVDLRTVARDAWAMVETGDATLRVDDDLGTADADRARVVELLSNLFRNSIEHGDDDGPVTVRVACEGDRLVVADDGPGIPADLRDQVLDRGVTTSDAGTGFGLAIVDEIAKAHGWEVDVGESESGGARFDIVGVR